MAKHKKKGKVLPKTTQNSLNQNQEIQNSLHEEQMEEIIAVVPEVEKVEEPVAEENTESVEETTTVPVIEESSPVEPVAEEIAVVEEAVQEEILVSEGDKNSTFEAVPVESEVSAVVEETTVAEEPVVEAVEEKSEEIIEEVASIQEEVNQGENTFVVETVEHALDDTPATERVEDIHPVVEDEQSFSAVENEVEEIKEEVEDENLDADKEEIVPVLPPIDVESIEKASTAEEISTAVPEEANAVVTEKPQQEKKAKKIKKERINSPESYSFMSKITGLIAVCFFVALFAFPAFFEQREMWTQHEVDYAQTFQYMQSSQDFLAPVIEKGKYLDEYPLPFWLMLTLDKIPQLEQFNLEMDFVFLVLSLFVFAFSIYMLALSTYQSSRVALGSVCIALSSFVFVGVEQLIPTLLLFMGLINISLALCFRAWVKAFAPLTLLCAFFVIALAFLTQGMFALFLPVIGSVIFLLLRGDLARLNERDGIFAGLALFLFLGGIFFLYNLGAHSVYIAQLVDFETLKQMLLNWQPFEGILYYLIAFVLLLLPYSTLLITGRWGKALVALPKNLKNSRMAARHEVEIERLVRVANGEKRAKADPEKYAECMRASGLFYLYSLVIASIIILVCYPPDSNVLVSILPVLPLVSIVAILFSRNIMSFSASRSVFYFVCMGLMFLFVGLAILIIAMLPEITALQLPWLSFIPHEYVEFIEIFSKFDLFALSAAFALFALCIFFMNKAYPQRILYFTAFGIAGIIWLAHFTVIPSLNPLLAREIPQIIVEEPAVIEEAVMKETVIKEEVSEAVDTEVKTEVQDETVASSTETVELPAEPANQDAVSDEVVPVEASTAVEG